MVDGRRDLVPLLMYHEILAEPPPAYRKYTLTPRAFAVQMAWLNAAGYTPVRLDDVLAYVEGRSILPHRPVAITFDDGYRGSVEHAVPVLVKRRFTATFFLVAGLMGHPTNWLSPRVGRELPLIDWSTARHLQSVGLECGSHCMSHRRLTDLSDAEVREELVGARRLLEEKLGRQVAHLAYPSGSVNAAVRQIAAEAGYRSACSVRIGLAARGEDALLLPRVPITGFDTILDFMLKLRTARTAHEVVRRTAARLPRAGRKRS